MKIVKIKFDFKAILLLKKDFQANFGVKPLIETKYFDGFEIFSIFTYYSSHLLADRTFK